MMMWLPIIVWLVVVPVAWGVLHRVKDPDDRWVIAALWPVYLACAIVYVIIKPVVQVLVYVGTRVVR